MSEIYTAINSIMAKVGHIGKDRNNQQQGFKYRGIDDAYNALNPLLAEFGVFTVPEVMEKTREERTNSKGTTLAFTCLRMKYTFYAKDGSSVSAIVEGEGMDSGDKSSNKAMAVAHKYALLQVFCIPTEEQKDPDAESHEVKPRDDVPAERVDAAIAEMMAAAEGGMAALTAAWKELPPPVRKAVMAAGGMDGAKKIALAADARHTA
ncbi:MAG: ERF family protein [Hyphomonadaceae bacterium]